MTWRTTLPPTVDAAAILASVDVTGTVSTDSGSRDDVKQVSFIVTGASAGTYPADSGQAWIPLPLTGGYTIRATAVDEAGNASGYQGTPFSFTVDATVPAEPVLINPPDLMVTNDATPTFDWSATAGLGGTYTLEYALDAAFTTGVETVVARGS